MKSVLDTLTRIPAEDIGALRKMWSGDLPTPRPLGQRPAVVIVDMMEGFVRDEYPTGWSATGVPCVEANAALRAAAHAADIPVIYTVSEQLPHAAQVGDWLRGRPGPSMYPFDSVGPQHDIVPELTPEPQDIVLTKPKPSAFFATQLESILNALDVDSLIVTGMTTSGCVRATVNDGFMLNRRVIVPVEAVADRSQLSHEVELFDMGAKYADIVSLESLLEDIRERS